MHKREFLVLAFVIFAVVMRLVPHPPNFTPITALALFGATTFSNRILGTLLPIIAMAISDIYLGFYSISIWVYSSFLLISLLAHYWKVIKSKNILISSLIFFLVTNFGVWISGYPLTLEGLLLCYTLAIPFLINTIIGDLFFSYVLKYSFKFTENKLILNYE